MSFIKTKEFSVSTAKEFINAVSVSQMNVNLYLAISHVAPWANDSIPDTPIDNTDNQVGAWRGMIGGKRITGYDMSLAVPRYDWTVGTIYTPYRNSGNTVFGTPFYVMTDNFDVYKCIDNSNNNTSTVKPTYTDTDRIITQSDGYTWKYMFTLSTIERNKWLTDNYMPIHSLSFDDGSAQWQVQQHAINGGIEFVSLDSVGANYNATVTVAVSGDGQSASVSGGVDTGTQTLANVTVSNPGTGYHYANVTISADSNTSGSGATANAIISPFGGHGSNPIYELGASFVIIDVALDGTENNTLTVNNDYRQIVLIKNPLVYGSNNAVMANTNFKQTTQVSVGLSGGNYTLDEYVFQGSSLGSSTFSGVVVDWDSSNNVLELTQTAGTISASALIGATSGTTRFVINTQNPDVQPYSGHIMYIDNIVPIERNVNQTEDIQVILSF